MSNTAGTTERLRGRKGQTQRERRLRRTGGLCERCLAQKPRRYEIADVVDHIIPLALGGSDEDNNTRNLCKPCHDTVTREQFGQRPKTRIGTDGWPM